MSRWQPIIDELLPKLARLIPGGGNFRDEIDDLIRAVEEILPDAEPLEVLDTPKRRQREFEIELRHAVSERSKGELSNRVWRETLNLLDHPFEFAGVKITRNS